MIVKSHSFIREIAPAAWDQFITDDHWYHSHAFLCVMEDSGVMHAHYRYLMFFEGEALVATAVLSDMEIDIALFIGDNLFLRGLRKVFPRFLFSRLLACGTPCSMGQKNLFIKEDRYYAAVVDLLNAEMENYCRQQNVKVRIYKEFKEAETKQLIQAASQKEYFRFYSMPSVEMTLDFASYETYKQKLRSGFRRQIRQSLTRIQCDNPEFVPWQEALQTDREWPCFTFLDPNLFTGKDFYPLYEKVMSRAQVKFEMLNEKFFTDFFHTFQSQMKILAMVHKGQILGVYILMKSSSRLSFIWAGKIFHKDNWDTYFNLMNALMAYAIAEGFPKLVLGQTAYYSKMKVGGTPEELFGFFHARNPMTHFVLKTLNPVIFPVLKLPALKPFSQHA